MVFGDIMKRCKLKFNSLLSVAIVIAISWMMLDHVVDAFEIKDRPMPDKFQEADVVVIARAVSSPHRLQFDFDGRTISVQGVSFETELVMKGVVPKKFELIVSPLIHENRVRCCIVGEKYLLFTWKSVDGRLNPVLGRFGVYRLSNELQK